MPTCFGTCAACGSGNLPSILYIRDPNGTWTCGLQSYLDGSGNLQKEWVGYGWKNLSRVNNDVPFSGCAAAVQGNVVYHFQIRCVATDDGTVLRVKRFWNYAGYDEFDVCDPPVYRNYNLSSLLILGSSTLDIEEIGDCADFEVSGTLANDSPSRLDPFGTEITIYPETEFPDPPYCCGRIVVSGCNTIPASGVSSIAPLYTPVEVRLYDEEGGTLLSSGMTDPLAGAYLIWPHRTSYWVEVDSPSERFNPIAQTLTLEGSDFWQYRCGGGVNNPTPIAVVSFAASDGYVCVNRASMSCGYPIKKTLTFTTSIGPTTVTYDEATGTWGGWNETNAPVLTGFTYSNVGVCLCDGCVVNNQAINLWFGLAESLDSYPFYRYGSVGLTPCPATTKFVRLSGSYPGLSTDCPAVDPGCVCSVLCAASRNGTNTFFPTTTPFRIVCPKPDEDIAFYMEGEFFSGVRPIVGSYQITE